MCYNGIAFPMRGDRATLGSDPSTSPGSRRQYREVLPHFVLPSRKPKALNPGGRGRAPGIRILGNPSGQRITACIQILFIFYRRQLFKFPLVPVVVVVIHPVINRRTHLFEGMKFGQYTDNLILHMSEETFLRGIVPAVSAPGHRLHEFSIFQL